MKRIERLTIARFVAFSMAVFVIASPMTDTLSGEASDNFAVALNYYRLGLYQQTITQLQQMPQLEPGKWPVPANDAQLYLLLGASYDKMGMEEDARAAFAVVKKMLDHGIITSVPQINGLSQAAITSPLYIEMFPPTTDNESFFNHHQPVTITEMMEQNVIHAPLKSSLAAKRSKRKKFPWLIATVATLAIGVTAVLLLSKKKTEKTEIPEIVWIKIPSGQFLMGDPFNEGDADEQPVHKVYLPDYYISKYEISRRQYNSYCAATKQPLRYNISTGENSGFAATGLSWKEADDFCTWLRSVSGQIINLPTEAQWEKAARGNTQYRYPWGNNPPNCSKAIFSGCDIWGSINSVTVCALGESPYGVRNMSGHAGEWCRDWYSPDYYSISPKIHPHGPADGTYRVVRGGHSQNDAIDIRIAARAYLAPNTYNPRIGIRIVKEIKGVSE